MNTAVHLQKADGTLHLAELDAECTQSLWRERLRVKAKLERDAVSAAQQHTILFPSRERVCVPRLPAVPLLLGAAAINSMVEVM